MFLFTFSVSFYLQHIFFICISFLLFTSFAALAGLGHRTPQLVVSHFQMHFSFLNCPFCSLEQRNLDLETEMVSLHEELDQERKKYTMVEIKLRNAERAKEDAERRNQMLQKEMEQFFSTFSDLTAAGNSATSEPRQPERSNPIWIQ